jgi:hypothetical protein
MPSTTCSKCHRANPDGAAFCYFDGHLLNGHGATGPLAIGRQPFPHPFVFTTGRQCRSYDELALACHEDWDEARNLLKQGYLERFLGGLGRADLARAARDAARAADPDLGLDELLDKLPSEVLQPPYLHAGSAEVNLGTLKVSEDRRFELRLENRGMRLLRGSVTCDDSPWLAVGEGAGAQQKLFQFTGSGAIPVHVVGQRLRAGNKPLEGRLVVESNGGSVTVIVRAAVPIRPFPDGPLKGATTPRRVAELAKTAPKEAAAYFENGAVARWYKDNGWIYPVQGPSASGIGAVQQFFEALGLTPPPKVEVSTRAIHLMGAVGERLDYVLQVATPEKRPVYAHGVSDQPWLKVGRPKLDGRTATLPIVVAEVPDRPGERLQAQVIVTANGNQRFPVTVTLAIEKGAARRPPPILEVIPTTEEVAEVPLASAVAAVPVAVAVPASRPERRSRRAERDDDDDDRPRARPAAAVPVRGGGMPALAHLAPVGALGLALLAVLVVDVFRPRAEEPQPGTVPVVDDSIDPNPLIQVQFHDTDQPVTLATGGSVKPGAPLKDQNDQIAANWPASMRFGLTMVNEGDPLRFGQKKRLTFEVNGVTNNTVVWLDGEGPRLGGGYKGWIWGESAWLRKDNGKPEGLPDWHGHWKTDGDRDVSLPKDVKKGEGEGRKSVWVYDQEQVTVTQFVQVVAGEQSRKLDTCLVRYLIENNDRREHRVGLRFMLDTYIGTNDGVPFTIPGERELCDTMKDFKTAADVPDFIEALERDDLTNPGTIAHLQLRLGGRIDPPDRVTLGAWPNPVLVKRDPRCQQEKTLWDVPLFKIKDNDPPDSCVTMYWSPKPLGPGEKREVGFAYGLGNVASDKDAEGRLGLSVGGRFVPGGEFTLTALVANPKKGETLKLELPPGFKLVEGELTQPVPPVPAGAARRTSPVTWKIKAGGEGSYTLKVTSSAGAAQSQPVRIRGSSIFD